MATLITIIALIGGLAIMTVLLMAFAYPELLLRALKFVFVKPVKSLARVGHHKAAPLVVKAGEAKTDTLQPK